MSLTYTCPNPDCGAALSTKTRPPAGKQVKCPKCGLPFVPEPQEKPAAGAGTFAFKDDPKGGGKPPQPAKPAAKPQAAAPTRARAADDDEDPESVRKGYGVVQETEEEKEAAERNKPTFGSMETKHRRSARGPATAALVMPANLLVLEGIVTCVAGVVLLVYGMWPLVFNDASPGDEEVEEAIVTMLLGVMTFGWGSMICYGASQMQELASYLWAMTGAVMGILPLLVGLFAVIALQSPKVKAGFAEVEGALDEDEEEDEKDDEDEEDDEDDEDDRRRRRK